MVRNGGQEKIAMMCKTKNCVFFELALIVWRIFCYKKIYAKAYQERLV